VSLSSWGLLRCISRLRILHTSSQSMDNHRRLRRDCQKKAVVERINDTD
jgi:hypothetical protein